MVSDLSPLVADFFFCNPYFEVMVNQMYPPELQLNELYFRYRGLLFNLHLLISNGSVSSKMYDKPDDFDFDIVNFPFWMVTFHVVLLMECIFLSSLKDLLEGVVMLVTLILVINADTMNWFQNLMSD